MNDTRTVDRGSKHPEHVAHEWLDDAGNEKSSHLFFPGGPRDASMTPS